MRSGDNSRTAQCHLTAQFVGVLVAGEDEAALAEFAASGQISELLHPIGIENGFAGIEAPAPGIVDGGEQGAACAESAGDQKRRLAIVGAEIGGMLGIDDPDAGLGGHAMAIPENFLEMIFRNSSLEAGSAKNRKMEVSAPAAVMTGRKPSVMDVVESSGST